MSQYVEGPEATQVIENQSQLVAYFSQAGKPREAWRIGTEYEMVGVSRRSGRAARYFGKRGIERILYRLADTLGWEPQEEGGHIIALRGPRANVALEPGAQIELSGEQCETIHCAQQELHHYLTHLLTAGDELDLAFLNLGMQPISPLDDIQWIPKTRYTFMAPYMEQVGTLGHRMMKQTASIQVNFDFSTEADAMLKLRVAMGLVPILTAMFANSPISDGGLNGFMTMRGHVWTETDRRRCGLLPFVFSEHASFEHYTEYALDVPMYFIVRHGRWIDMTGIPFRRFLAEGHEGERATMEDWSLHLTTLFPEVRLKRYLEIRCIDNQPYELMLAVPALCKGVFYEPDALWAAWDLVKKWSWEERMAAYLAAHRQALGARVRGVTLLDLAKELLLIAWEGLERHNQCNQAGENETMYLERLREELWKGQCPAYNVIEKWMGEWNYDPLRLVEGTAYRLPAAN
ncbi:MAG: glutamate-cysteine ligase family protein [Candidatus Binatia bacterium]|nr:glutamate-cysteine ligase family protein [Candidatus Binatia bacterium]